jgi:hypothetical protein
MQYAIRSIERGPICDFCQNDALGKSGLLRERNSAVQSKGAKSRLYSLHMIHQGGINM